MLPITPEAASGGLIYFINKLFFVIDTVFIIWPFRSVIYLITLSHGFISLIWFFIYSSDIKVILTLDMGVLTKEAKSQAF